MIVILVALAALIAVNLVRGDLGGLVGLVGLGRSGTWVATLVLLAALLSLAGYALKKRWDGIFIDERNKISLSRMQLVLWTLLLVSALFTAGLSNVSLGATNPLEIVVPASVWALLGIGSFTFVASPAILMQKEKAGAPERLASISENLKTADGLKSAVESRGQVVTKGSPEDARWLDVIRGDTNDADYVDAGKVQQLAFTLLLLIVYGTAIFNLLKPIAAITAFPPVDGGFVSLLGLSHAAYLAYKAVPK
ncbi:hypothetical protein IVA79_18540 [Bradyrhizobium sp. 138]|uniref:hypothetical protein n=1 Tax=Bradyrhizobium sp. 138 TaxID=2782615 RepID=UPI001FF7231C|nr:hypothetical protein [Bradyrhizobium sp. 138]MCK1735884.1 hypothetical protein [Bradyrhizobium sp. 138]